MGFPPELVQTLSWHALCSRRSKVLINEITVEQIDKNYQNLEVLSLNALWNFNTYFYYF